MYNNNNNANNTKIAERGMHLLLYVLETIDWTPVFFFFWWGGFQSRPLKSLSFFSLLHKVKSLALLSE